jgi:hypothetical protein
MRVVDMADDTGEASGLPRRRSTARTTLAWVPTALALSVAGALPARFAIKTGLPLLGYVVGAAHAAAVDFGGARRGGGVGTGHRVGARTWVPSQCGRAER